MAPTQKALIVTEVGKPVTLTSDQAIPEPGPKQIQIKVKVAGINPHDQKARDHGLFIAENLPAILTNGKNKSLSFAAPRLLRSGVFRITPAFVAGG